GIRGAAARRSLPRTREEPDHAGGGEGRRGHGADEERVAERGPRGGEPPSPAPRAFRGEQRGERRRHEERRTGLRYPGRRGQDEVGRNREEEGPQKRGRRPEGAPAGGVGQEDG